MGKRELVLIVAFIFVGTVLYQATAPPTPEGGGFSLRRIIDNIRREVGTHHEYLADERTETLPIGDDIAEVRIAGVREVRIEGSDRRDGSATLQVYSTGLDEPEARSLGKKTLLKTARSGDILSIEVTYPREGRQRANLTLLLPQRVRVRVARTSSLSARGLAGIEFDETRGEAKVSAIAGAVRGTHTGGELACDNVKEIDLTIRRAETTLENIAGNVRLDLTSGTLTARAIRGPIEIDGNRVAVELNDIAGTIRADLTRGSLEANGVSAEVRVDARGTELRLDLAKPAPVTAITTDENINVHVPPTVGFTLDATAQDGEIRLPDGAPHPSGDDQERRARGPVRGGGPTLALRTSHGDIVLR